MVNGQCRLKSGTLANRAGNSRRWKLQGVSDKFVSPVLVFISILANYHISILFFLTFAGLMLLYKEFTFDSAHFLPNVPDGHKCKNIHGHTYRLRVWLKGKPDPQFGWIIDFAELKKIIKPVVAQLDHKLMNDLPGLQNPTCELIAVWIWDQLKPSLPAMHRIELHETPTSGVIYEGE